MCGGSFILLATSNKNNTYIILQAGAPGLRVLKPEKKKLTEINGIFKEKTRDQTFRGKVSKRLILFIPQNF
jgi:hypothetical protein